MKNLAVRLSTAAIALLAVAGSASPSLAKAHDQGVGDGAGLNRDLGDLGSSNAGGSGDTIGGPGSLGVSEGQKDGARGDRASGAGANNSGAHGSVSGTVDDAARD